MKKILILMVLIAMPLLHFDIVNAHPGRTDANGGHTCKTNCEKGGLKYGEYHYHNGGAAPVKPKTQQPPTQSKPAPRPVAPRTPITRNQTVTREEPIEFKTITHYDYREYPEFMLLKQNGSAGKKTITTNIVYTDGKETSRVDVKSEINTEPQDEITIRGGRTRSDAVFYGLAESKRSLFSSNKGKYNIWGRFVPNTEVYLTVNGKKMKTIRTNERGWFTFERVKVSDKSWLHLFAKKSNENISVSEKTQVNLSQVKLLTEYDMLHR